MSPTITALLVLGLALLPLLMLGLLILIINRTTR